MAVTQPTYDVGAGAVSLPVPATYDQPEGFYGGTSIKANGAAVHQNVAASRKRTIKMGWNNVSAADVAILRTFWAALATASCTFVTPENTSITSVRRAPNAQMPVRFLVAAGGAIRYTVTVELRED